MTDKPSDGQVWLGKDGKSFGPFTPQQIEEMKRNGEYGTYSWVWDPDKQSWASVNPPTAPPPDPSGEDSDDFTIGGFSPMDASDSEFTMTGFTKTTSSTRAGMQQPEFTLSGMTATETETELDTTAPPAPGAPPRPAKLPGSRPPSLQPSAIPEASLDGVTASFHVGKAVVTGQVSDVSPAGCMVHCKDVPPGTDQLGSGHKLKVTVSDALSRKSETIEATIGNVKPLPGEVAFLLVWSKMPAILE